MFEPCTKSGVGGGIGALPRFRATLARLIPLASLVSLSAAAMLPLPAPAPAAEYLVRTWETEDGLPENSATAMVQTPDGYLWFGTFNGLVRFDGVKFTVFNPANTPQLPSAAIVNLHGDGTGRLWVSTDRGLCRLDGEGWRTFGPGDGWVGNYARAFAGRPNGDFLCTTFDGHVLEYAGGRLRSLPAPPGEAGHGYFAYADEAGRWWVIQNRFIGRWDGQRWVETIPIAEPIADAVCAGTAPDGSLLLVDGQQLRRWRQGREVGSRRLPERPGGPWSVAEDSRGDVWICTYSQGLCRVQPDGGFQRLTEENGLSERNTRFVYEDREHSLWVGTSGGGLQRFRSRRFQILGTESGLAERAVRSVAPRAAGGLWIAAFGGGLSRWQPGGITRIPLPGFASSIVYGQCVLEDRSGRTWFGAFERGLWFVEADTARPVPPEAAGGRTFTALFQDSRGRVWIGGDRELAVFEDGGFRRQPGPGGLSLGGVSAMAEDPAGGLWLSNLEGVFRLQAAGVTELHDAAGAPLRDILCFLPEPEGAVWLGTRSHGLLRWVDDQWSHLDAAAGFPVPGVNGILPDDRGYLWMPSRYGVVRASRAALNSAMAGGSLRGECQLLDTSDGLVSVDCPGGFQPACARDPQGRLWFATLKGVAVVDPRKFQPNPHPPPVHIESLVYHTARTRPNGDGNPGPPGHPPTRSTRSGTDRIGALAPGAPPHTEVRILPPFAQPLRLPPGSHRLELHYTALSLAAPEKVRFQVKLEGHDRDWQDRDGPRVAQFHELAPGDYVFRVRAANNDGVWNLDGTSLAFVVLPRYWQTGWFRAGVVVLLVGAGGGAVWAGFRRRLGHALERERNAHAVRELAGRLISAQETERRRIARELHDDFSQRLALLSVEMELLGSAAPGPAPAGTPRLGEMATRVKELSSEVHRMAYELHPAKLEQLGLVAAARGYCRELSQKSGLQVTFDAGDFPRIVPSEVALCFYRIIQESLQNALRHSGAREARVELRVEPAGWCLRIRDAGRGFAPPQAAREGGLGLSSMRERTRQLRGRLQIDSAPGRGTTIQAFVPHPSPPAPPGQAHETTAP